MHFRASTLSWAAFVCFFSAASEFVRIHKFCMSSSGDESVVASLVKVSFGECSAAALLCCMLHVSSAKLLNLLKFTFIAWVFYWWYIRCRQPWAQHSYELLFQNFTIMCGFNMTLLDILTSCCVFALITHEDPSYEL